MGILRAGDLNRTVTLQKRGEPSHDGRSRKPGDWVTVATRRASVMPVPGREVEEGAGRSGLRLTSFWFRHDSVTAAMTEEWSLLYKGQRYDVAEPPRELGRAEGIEVKATASSLVNAAP